MRAVRLRASLLSVAVLVALLVALLAYGLSARSPSDTIDSALADGRPTAAPEFELPVLGPDGVTRRLGNSLAPRFRDGRVALRELRGRPLVINFWASWCPPCRSETPLLERTWRSARTQGVLFLGLNMQDLSDDARNFMEEFDVSYPNVRDRSDDVAREWGAVALPETFFVDLRGRVVGHVVGAVSGNQLAAGIEAAVAGQVLGSRSGGDRRSTR